MNSLLSRTEFNWDAQCWRADFGICLIIGPRSEGWLRELGVFNSRKIRWLAAGSKDEPSAERKKYSGKACGANDMAANGGLFEPRQGLFFGPWTWINPSLKSRSVTNSASTARLWTFLWQWSVLRHNYNINNKLLKTSWKLRWYMWRHCSYNYYYNYY